MELSKRDKFLMDQAFKVGEMQHYTDVETWLGDTIDDVGHTVEDHVAFDASKIQEPTDGTVNTAEREAVEGRFNASSD